MKSGQVLTDKKYKWYEPEYWRFGDPSGEGYINYPRHAAGQIYGVSAPVARFGPPSRHPHQTPLEVMPASTQEGDDRVCTLS